LISSFRRVKQTITNLGRRPQEPGVTYEQYSASEQERAQGDFDNYLNNFGQSDMGLTAPPQQIGDMFKSVTNMPPAAADIVRLQGNLNHHTQCSLLVFLGLLDLHKAIIFLKKLAQPFEKK
jgi:hypothetical protein